MHTGTPKIFVSLPDSVSQDNPAYQAFRGNDLFVIETPSFKRSSVPQAVSAVLSVIDLPLLISFVGLYFSYKALPSGTSLLPNLQTMRRKARAAFRQTSNTVVDGLIKTLVAAQLNKLSFYDESLNAYAFVTFKSKAQLEYKLFLVTLALKKIKTDRARYPDKTLFWLKFERSGHLYLTAMGSDGFQENNILELI